MEFEKIKNQLLNELKKIASSGDTERDKINKSYDDKIKKLNEQRKEKLSKIKDTSTAKRKITEALAALGHIFDSTSDSEAVKKVTVEGERVPFPLEIPKEYSPKLKNVDKVVFALSQIKTGTPKDVESKLLELDPANEKIVKQVANALSVLGKANKISRTSQGKGFVYSIN